MEKDLFLSPEYDVNLVCADMVVLLHSWSNSHPNKLYSFHVDWAWEIEKYEIMVLFSSFYSRDIFMMIYKLKSRCTVSPVRILWTVDINWTDNVFLIVRIKYLCIDLLIRGLSPIILVRGMF